MASVQERRNKNGEVTGYRVRVCVGRDDDYKQQFRSTTFPRPEGLTPAKERKEIQRQADEWEREQRAEYERTRQRIPKDKITFAAFVRDHWLADHVNDGAHKPSSISFYTYMANDLIDYFGEKKKLKMIDTEEVKRYINWMRGSALTKQGKPYSATTIQHHYSTLRNVMEYARRMKYIKLDPCMDLLSGERPKREKHGVVVVEKADRERFLAALDGEPALWVSMVRLMYHLGPRRGEAVGLKWGDIDFEDKLLHIQRNVTPDTKNGTKYHIGTPKTGDDRIIPIDDPRVWEPLMAWKAEQEERFGVVLPTAYIYCSDADPFLPMYPTVPTRWLKRWEQKNGLPDISPHDLRHTAGTIMAENNVSPTVIMAVLGHSDYNTTTANYINTDTETMRDELRRTRIA